MIEASQDFSRELIMDDHSPAHSRVDWEDHPDAAEIPAYYQRRSAGIWACLALLAVALGVSLIYGYTVLEEQGVQLSQIPGLTRSLTPLSQHLANLENRLADSRISQGLLAARVQTIDAESKAAILETRQQTGRMASQMQSALSRQIKQQSSVLQAQISSVANARSNESIRLASLESQILAQQSELAAARGDYERELAVLREQQVSEHRELTSLRSSIPSQPVTFDAAKDQPIEVAPGIRFRLAKVDVGRQRFDGWIESTETHQRVSVQSQSVRTPVVFFASETNKPLVLVVTQIVPNGASGYMLLTSAKAVSASVVSAADNSEIPTKSPLTQTGLTQ